MRFRKLEQQGFTHYIAVAVTMLVFAIGGTFLTVAKANRGHEAKSNLLPSSQQNTNQDKLSSSPGTGQTVPQASSPAKSVSASASKPVTASTKTVVTATPKTTYIPPPSSPAPTQSNQALINALTSLITNMENGSQANVTANNVSVPGPITTAQARPIVFTYNGQTYFAYRQGQPADFNTTPSQTANSMAIVTATVNGAALTQAHLDKANNLVDPDFQVVGYSTGGS